ncbi:hypothetical protein P6O07_004366 [Escherichia coli]|jgi:hypothetical protein|uniref:Uncharacterized protein n=2 Tax=Escherichia coli TaxID=562 RepID=A0A3Z8SZM8_ECOLX|nr:hypothetical protein [Escherichia coli]EBY2983295.1 hypothetical protein [Salmonella enterica subsp. enterica serovar Durban]ECO6189147.1 hypothetical protein [Salmonella enterica]EAC1429438.1 hypothetical protein [Escherichia coli]EET8023973.1 hypothetical protein [Escherichia coli]EEV1307018.1 hypothetical protein [Escherichia coli]
MSERNYEAIGRCVILRKRIEENLCALRKIKSEIVSADSPFLSGEELNGAYSLVLSIETNVNRCRELLDSTIKLVDEHNQYAVAAGLGAICIRPEGEAF